jgi:hypothetical protein
LRFKLGPSGLQRADPPLELPFRNAVHDRLDKPVQFARNFGKLRPLAFSAPALGSVTSSIDAVAECIRYDETFSGSKVRKWYRSLSSH